MLETPKTGECSGAEGATNAKPIKSGAGREEVFRNFLALLRLGGVIRASRKEPFGAP